MRFLPAIRRWIKPRATMIPRHAAPESRSAQNTLGATRGQARFPIRNVAYRRSRLFRGIHEQALQPQSAYRPTRNPERTTRRACAGGTGSAPLIALASVPCARSLAIAAARFMKNASLEQNRGTQLSQMGQPSGSHPSCQARRAGALRGKSSNFLSRRITPRDPPPARREIAVQAVVRHPPARQTSARA